MTKEGIKRSEGLENIKKLGKNANFDLFLKLRKNHLEDTISFLPKSSFFILKFHFCGT